MTAGVPRILVVDDELPIRKFLRISLAAKRFDVIEAGNGADALQQLEGGRPDLVVLDLGLPDVHGEELIQAIRAVSAVPIIVLSVRAEEQQKVAAFDAGASDYVTKPFSIGELTARIRAALRDRRAGPLLGPVFEVGGVRVDIAQHRVFLGSNELKLTPKEFDLLAVLVVNHGRIVTHRQLLSELWGKTHQGDTQYLRVYVGQLRLKLGDDPADPRFIANEPGIGYRFLDPG
jgi:two-component system, OmpR family, KDP operon response regulator KdpE